MYKQRFKFEVKIKGEKMSGPIDQLKFIFFPPKTQQFSNGKTNQVEMSQSHPAK